MVTAEIAKSRDFRSATQSAKRVKYQRSLNFQFEEDLQYYFVFRFFLFKTMTIDWSHANDEATAVRIT